MLFGLFAMGLIAFVLVLISNHKKKKLLEHYHCSISVDTAGDETIHRVNTFLCRQGMAKYQITRNEAYYAKLILSQFVCDISHRYCNGGLTFAKNIPNGDCFPFALDYFFRAHSGDLSCFYDEKGDLISDVTDDGECYSDFGSAHLKLQLYASLYCFKSACLTADFHEYNYQCCISNLEYSAKNNQSYGNA